MTLTVMASPLIDGHEWKKKNWTDLTLAFVHIYNTGNRLKWRGPPFQFDLWNILHTLVDFFLNGKLNPVW